jgi:FkbM family methyltransferase
MYMLRHLRIKNILKITSRIYQSTIKRINSLPVKYRNIFIKTIKCLRIPNNKFYKDLKYTGPIIIHINNKKFKFLSEGGTIENEIFWKGIHNSWEPETIWIWEKLSRISHCIIDIGANTGLYSLVSETVNLACIIYAFEPAQNTFEKLKINVAINNYKISAHKLALSNNDGYSTFYEPVMPHQTSASLSARMLKENPDNRWVINECIVQTETLDNFAKSKDLKKIDLIKIDVELHEPEVFEGMTGILKTHRPYLVFEVLTDDVADRLNLILSGLDYQIYGFAKINNKYWLNKVDKLDGPIGNNWDYLGCPKEKNGELIKLNVNSI